MAQNFDSVMANYLRESLKTFEWTFEFKWKQDDLRPGQRMFNYFHTVDADIANQITGTDADCFYFDGKMNAFLDQFEKLYNQKHSL
jgi:hypothetical protein